MGETAELNTAPTAALYTEHPYPGDGVLRATCGRYLALGLKRHAPELLTRGNFTLADIGCGTGEAMCGVAARFPRANVVAVDINPASLKLAQELAGREKLNVRFVRTNITEGLRDSIDEAGLLPAGGFDVVTSFGVLHHLEEPARGFAAVRELVKPGGLFCGYVYSRFGRWDDVAVRALLDPVYPVTEFRARAEAVRALALSGKFTVGGFIKKLRRRLKFGPPVQPVEMFKVYLRRRNIVHLSDTFSNPCEHLFLFGELRAIVERTGWQFLALAEGAGLPISAEAHTRDPRALSILRSLGEDFLYDYLAYYYACNGFTFFLKAV